MHELYDILRKRREARGSIDFDLPEAEVILDAAGVIDAIKPTERNVAHRIIEEFMLAANEVVASELVFANQPGIFRVHQQPDPQKLEDLREILKEFKLLLRGDLEQMRPGELQRVLKSVEGTPEERFLTNIVLRSMKRASYSEENIGHFALAIANYAHFTSPIRRYPDLLVHRGIKAVLAGKRYEGVDWPAVGQHCSETERRADDATRDVEAWLKTYYMQDRVGEEFDGTISGVTAFGLFVTLDEMYVDGLVHISDLGQDYFKFDAHKHMLRGERSGVRYQLAGRVRVKVVRVDLEQAKIDFVLVPVVPEKSGTQGEERDRIPASAGKTGSKGEEKKKPGRYK